jgi:outer membrane protein assembly factor BamE (lipoprotein component of BamABCDE complex)
MRTVILWAALLAAAGCGRKQAANYKHCLKLRVGMTREDMLKVMGAPEETLPFVEGKSLDYLRGRTAYEWSNPATMPGPDHVSVEDASGKIASIRCSNAEITASVFVEPPAPSTATAAIPAPIVVVAPPVAPPPAASAPVTPAAEPAKKAPDGETVDLPEAVVTLPKGWKTVHLRHEAGAEGSDTTFKHIYFSGFYPGMKGHEPPAWADAIVSRSPVARLKGADGTLHPTFDEVRTAIDCKYTGPRFGLTSCSHPLGTVAVAGVTGYAFLDEPSTIGGHPVQSSVVAFEKNGAIFMIAFTARRDSFDKFIDEFDFFTAHLQIKTPAP